MPSEKRKAAPRADARRVAIPVAVAITAFLAFCMLTGMLTDKSAAVDHDAPLFVMLSDASKTARARELLDAACSCDSAFTAYCKQEKLAAKLWN